MKNSIYVLSALILSMLILGCGVAKLTPKEAKLLNTKVYTQMNMWIYKGKIIGTNYKVNTLVPVNTEVTITSVSSKAIRFTFDGKTVDFVNIPKYTKQTINGLLTRSFASTKINLNKYDKETKENILRGDIELGMTKEEVLIARGYPPVHATSSLKTNRWKFWENRFGTIVYDFKNDKVSKIID